MWLSKGSSSTKYPHARIRNTTPLTPLHHYFLQVKMSNHDLEIMIMAIPQTSPNTFRSILKHLPSTLLDTFSSRTPNIPPPHQLPLITNNPRQSPPLIPQLHIPSAPRTSPNHQLPHATMHKRRVQSQLAPLLEIQIAGHTSEPRLPFARSVFPSVVIAEHGVVEELDGVA